MKEYLVDIMHHFFKLLHEIDMELFGLIVFKLCYEWGLFHDGQCGQWEMVSKEKIWVMVPPPILHRCIVSPLLLFPLSSFSALNVRAIINQLVQLNQFLFSGLDSTLLRSSKCNQILFLVIFILPPDKY